MDKISYDVILQIQKRLNIVDVISEYLPLERKGKNYFAICPFHDDHNPSMSISPEKQIYTCFVCGASGNVFNFVMNYEKISFGQAVKKLAEKVGIKLNIADLKNATKRDDKLKKYYDIYDLVNKYYQNNLKSVYGKKATEYLHQRQISDEIIKEFDIGLSLNDNEVSKFLTSKGCDVNDLVELGISGFNGNFTYDVFHNRIMFPLYDLDGQVVGFSGRIYNGEKENKYLNSKESVVFKKGSLLYNYHRAINYARESKQIIVVEGFMDVIRLSCVGIKNVVATMGTAITKEHADLIRRLSKNVVLCFDGDAAGKKATTNAINVLEDIGIKPKIIRLEENLDPDEYVIKKKKEAFLTHLNNAMSVFDFKIDAEKERIDFNNYEDISSYVKSMAQELNEIKDPIVYELSVKKLSKETGVDASTINSFVANVPKKIGKIMDKPKQTSKSKYEKAQEYLIYYMLRNVDVIIMYQNNVAYLSNKLLSKIALEILDFYDQKHYINVTDFTIFLEDKTDLINEVLRIDSYDLPAKMTVNQIKDYIKTIDDGILKHEKEKIKRQISEETNVAKKIILLEKLAGLKKKECK